MFWANFTITKNWLIPDRRIEIMEIRKILNSSSHSSKVLLYYIVMTFGLSWQGTLRSISMLTSPPSLHPVRIHGLRNSHSGNFFDKNYATTLLLPTGRSFHHSCHYLCYLCHMLETTSHCYIYHTFQQNYCLCVM